MVELGIYEHFKGGRYEVIGEGLLESTEEPVVIYKALYENERSSLWVRPVSSFLETVEVEGQLIPRFKIIES
jgi:hypothetical protein